MSRMAQKEIASVQFKLSITLKFLRSISNPSLPNYCMKPKKVNYFLNTVVIKFMNCLHTTANTLFIIEGRQKPGHIVLSLSELE